MWRKENLCVLLVSVQIGTATMENNMEVPQKKLKWPYNPAIPLLDISPKGKKPPIQKRYMHPYAHYLQHYL